MGHTGDHTPHFKWHSKHHALPADLVEVFDRLDTGVVRIDADRRVRYANPAALAILGRPDENVEGSRLEELLPLSVSSQLSGATARAEKENAVQRLETRLQDRGHPWISVRIVPAGGCFTLFFEDVTAVREGEEALRKANEELGQQFAEHMKSLRQTGRRLEEQKELLLTIIDNIPVMLTFYDSSGSIRLVNKAFEELAGWSLQEARSMNLIAACFPDAAYRKEVWEFMMKARPGWKDLELTTRSGMILPSSWAYVRLSDGSLIGIGIDISERRKEERFREHLLQTQKMEALGNLAGGIAQNLKNAFTPILIDTEVLMADLGRTNPHYPMLEEMMHAISYGIELVKHLLTFSRRTPQLKRPLNIVATAEEAMNFLRASLPSTIEIRYTRSLEEARVLADSTQIKQVLVNLGSTAGHSMRRKGGTLEVDLSGVFLDEESAVLISPDLAVGDYARIRVSDTGPGMTEETIEHIFEPFYTPEGEGEGAGLSLSVVHGIVKNHGGAVTAASAVGRGTVITVYLPLETAHQQSG